MIADVKNYVLPPAPGSTLWPLMRSAYDNMALVAGWYMKYFDRDNPQKGLSTEDDGVLLSHECLLFCYYDHFNGRDELFRDLYRSRPWASFRRICNGRVCIHAETIQAETESCS